MSRHVCSEPGQKFKPNGYIIMDILPAKVNYNLNEIARQLGGEVSNGQINCPGPGPDPRGGLEQ
jgi:hypothetical protein